MLAVASWGTVMQLELKDALYDSTKLLWRAALKSAKCVAQETFKVCTAGS